MVANRPKVLLFNCPLMYSGERTAFRVLSLAHFHGRWGTGFWISKYASVMCLIDSCGEQIRLDKTHTSNRGGWVKRKDELWVQECCQTEGEWHKIEVRSLRIFSFEDFSIGYCFYSSFHLKLLPPSVGSTRRRTRMFVLTSPMKAMMIFLFMRVCLYFLSIYL